MLEIQKRKNPQCQNQFGHLSLNKKPKRVKREVKEELIKRPPREVNDLPFQNLHKLTKRSSRFSMNYEKVENPVCTKSICSLKTISIVWREDACQPRMRVVWDEETVPVSHEMCFYTCNILYYFEC